MTRFINVSDAIKVFGMTNQLIEADLDRVEEKYDFDLGRGLTVDTPSEDLFYLQFDASVRAEARKMAKQCEIMYCMEKSIRMLIAEALEDEKGEDWWGTENIPQSVLDSVGKRMKRERDSVVSLRSQSPIDYTTFGELGD